MPRTIKYIIDEKYNDKKVLTFLKGKAEYSHRLITKLKQNPYGITLNGNHIRTIDLVKTGDVLCVKIPDDSTKSVSEPTDIPLEIVYEDDDLIIINKPATLAVHESHNHLGDTLSNALSFYLSQNGKSSVFRAVGRLDKGTSGLIVCALNKYAASKLSGKIYKEYLAIANGVFEGSGTIDAPIFRPDPIKTFRVVDSRGERAVTHWQAIKTDGKVTLLKIHLETGRTHQIRVHFSSIGSPLVGDTMYGTPDDRIAHQALHCCYCKLTHPVTNKIIECSAPTPEEMSEIINK